MKIIFCLCFSAGFLGSFVRALALADIGDNGSPPTAFPLGLCQGDCDRDSECFGDLVCYQRTMTQTVPGCTGTGISGKDYCYSKKASGELLNIGENGFPTVSFPLGECQGDCDSDAECVVGLKCFQRSGTEPVPGCSGTGVSGKDYCYNASTTPAPANPPATPVPTTKAPTTKAPTTKAPTTKAPTTKAPTTKAPTTKAPTTKAPTTKAPIYVPVVTLAPVMTAAPKSGELVNVGDNGLPVVAFPLRECQGDCDSDAECIVGLKCFQRSGTEAVPGCSGTGVSGKDYCYNASTTPAPANPPATPVPTTKAPTTKAPTTKAPTTKAPTTTTSLSPMTYGPVATFAPIMTAFPTNPPLPTVGQVTYYPGNLTVTRSDKYGRTVTLSTGMEGRAIAYTGERVQYTNGSGGQSSLNFHDQPDAAGVFPAADNGFYYATNSEVSSGNGGGVYVIDFDANGEVKGYRKTLSSSLNCGGGKTPWNTWVSCEENGSSGRVYQTDPSGSRVSQMTDVVARGGNYESFAYDVRDINNPRFFTTEDSSSGALVRFAPSAAGVACFQSAEKWCTLHNGGTYTYLRVDAGTSGTFSWTTEALATPTRYPNAEGIDVVDGVLYFVSKTTKTLFRLELDAGTFTRTSTLSGAFNLQPDQLRALASDPNEIIYFCEDGGSACDLHGRNTANGKFFTVVEGTGYDTETSGLGFSPDSKYIFLSFQGPGVIWQFWRQDGFPFSGSVVDIKYH